MKKRSEAEYCILTAAKLIAPHIEDTFGGGNRFKAFLLATIKTYRTFAGFDWCVEAIKSSEYAKLVGELEINKAVMFLKQRQLPEAIETLKAFDNDSSIAASAATNLSFIYYLVRIRNIQNEKKGMRNF